MCMFKINIITSFNIIAQPGGRPSRENIQFPRHIDILTPSFIKSH